MPTRTATATWEGGLQGTGAFTGESGTLGGAYSVGTRFGDQKGSNPEELLAAAEAACYSMALSLNLMNAGTPVTKVETKAACTVEKQGEGYTITTMKLTVRASVPNVDPKQFMELAEKTKTTCPVSKAFAGNMKFELDAKLV